MDVGWRSELKRSTRDQACLTYLTIFDPDLYCQRVMKRRLKLSHRIVAMATFLILLAAGVTGVSLFQIYRLNAAIGGFADDLLPVQRQIGRLSVNVAEEGIALTRVAERVRLGNADEARSEAAPLSAARERSTAAIEAARTELDGTTALFRSQAIYGDIDAALTQLTEQYEAFDARVAQALAYLRGERAALSAAELADLVESQDALRLGVRSLSSEVEELGDATVNELRDQGLAAASSIMALLLVGITAGAIISALIIRGVQRQLGADPEHVRSIAHKISDGQLSPDTAQQGTKKTRGLLLSVRQMESALVTMVSGIRDSVVKTKNENTELASAADQTAASTDQIKATISTLKEQTRQLSESVDSVSTAVEEIKANINGLSNQAENQASAVHQTSSSMEQINASIRNVAKTTDSRQEASSRLIETINSGREKVEQVSSHVGDLSENTESIQEVAAIINNISAQTNLLSMNAAIEAAHAGEYGKGFAVVAEEIRTLAEHSSENARKIGEILKENTQIVGTLDATSQQTLEVYGEVETNTQETIDYFRENAAAMNELAAGASEIDEAVQILNQTSTTVQEGSHEIQNAVSLIWDSISAVKTVANSVVDATSEIGSGSEQISSAMNDISSSITEISNKMESLEGDVGQFKIA